MQAKVHFGFLSKMNDLFLSGCFRIIHQVGQEGDLFQVMILRSGNLFVGCHPSAVWKLHAHGCGDSLPHRFRVTNMHQGVWETVWATKLLRSKNVKASPVISPSLCARLHVIGAAVESAYHFKNDSSERLWGRLHFLTGNVCVCEPQTNGPRVHFFSERKREMKGGKRRVSARTTHYVGLGQRE